MQRFIETLAQLPAFFLSLPLLLPTSPAARADETGVQVRVRYYLG